MNTASITEVIENAADSPYTALSRGDHGHGKARDKGTGKEYEYVCDDQERAPDVIRTWQVAFNRGSAGYEQEGRTRGKSSSVFWCARWVQLKMRAALLAFCSAFSAYTDSG
jgi:hypothetical protein